MNSYINGSYTWDEFQKIQNDLVRIRFKDVKKECDRRGIKCSKEKNYIHIITEKGKWKFNASETPIKLQHKNYRFRQNTMGNYHLQWTKNINMRDLVQYIENHDK